MNPWDILAWVATISISLMLTAITISVIRTALKPTRATPTQDIYAGRRKD